MDYPKAYIQYLIHFHGTRDYFECHDVLEEYWKRDDPEVRKSYWLALIQIAVSLYHHRRGNFVGAEKMLKNAVHVIQHEQKAILSLSLDYDSLLSLLTQRLHDIKVNKQYVSFNLPINDKKLLSECKQICGQLGCTWGEASDMENNELIHKHKLRDRSEIISERQKQKKRREADRIEGDRCAD